MNKFVVQDRTVTLPADKNVTFEHPVKEAIQIGEVIIVILHIPEGTTLTENVFAISKTGQILWQIERIKETSFNPQDRYVGIVSHDQGIVMIGNWNGMVVDVDLLNGRVKAKRFLK